MDIFAIASRTEYLSWMPHFGMWGAVLNKFDFFKPLLRKFGRPVPFEELLEPRILYEFGVLTLLVKLSAEEGGLPSVIPFVGRVKRSLHRLAALAFFVLRRLSPKRCLARVAVKQKPDYVRLCAGAFAEEGGFEPPDPVKDLRFSRPVH